MTKTIYLEAFKKCPGSVTFPLLKYQCGFCKSFNTQHCLIVMVEKWKKNCGTLIIDFSKDHHLLTAKLHIYVF